MEKKINLMLEPVSLGLSGGIIWGASVFIITMLSLWTGYANSLLTGLSKLYIGYTISYAGSIIGAVYGFLDAFIGLFIFAWIYNKFIR